MPSLKWRNTRKNYICLLIGTSILGLVILPLTIYHSSPRCSPFQKLDPDSECQPYCPINAITFNSKLISICPFNPLTIIIGIIGLVIAQFNVIIAYVGLKKAKFRVLITPFSVLTVMVLVAFCALMFKDMFIGEEYQKNNYPSSYKKGRTTLLANAIATFILIVNFVCLAFKPPLHSASQSQSKYTAENTTGNSLQAPVGQVVSRSRVKREIISNILMKDDKKIIIAEFEEYSSEKYPVDV